MKRVCSIFSQILQLIPRDGFEASVQKHQAERHARGFSSWGQLVAMLFCQLAQAKSLREITEGLRASEGKLKHLGLPEAPARSTLAYANSHRNWELYETVFQQLLAHCQKRLGVAKAGSKLGLPGKLLSLDATVIDLCASVFDWAHFRTTKGAVKLHLLLDHDGYLPSYAVITEGKVHEIQVARKLKLQRGAMLVFDRGYTDYGWFQQLTEEGVHFVTRLKDNAAYIVLERRPAIGAGVRADEIVVLEKQASSEAAPFLRRVRYWDEGKQRELVFLTNHLELSATKVAEVYKERWQIELLFESPTWCTPLDVMEFQESVALNRPWAGSLVGSVQPGIARRPLYAGSRVRPRRAASPANVFAESACSIVVGVTARTAATSLTDISLRACRSPSR